MTEPTILAIDTATENCSVALSHQGKLYLRSEVAPQKHANLVLPMIEELLSESKLSRQDLQIIAYGAGPGSFTGVRIAVSTAQALAFGLGLKVFGQNDLKLLVAKQLLTASAADASTAARYGLACIDARMGEVYVALYRLEPASHRLETVIEEKVIKPEQAMAEILEHSEALGSMVCAGTGIAILERLGLGEQLRQAGNNVYDPEHLELYPVADALITCAQYEGMQLTDPSEAEPLYCRNEVTWKKIGEQ